jgi:hypothetical protein
MERCNGRTLEVILIFSFVLFFLAPTLLASIRIQPAYVEVQMDRGRPAGRFLISNVGEQEERYRINAVHFTYSEQGGLRQSKTGDHSLAQWIRFNPREITLPPKTQRAVRFAIVPRGKLQPGEYWAAMELESLNVNVVTTKSDQAGRSVKLRTVTAIMAPIFGSVGKVSYSGEIKQLELTKEDGAIFLEALVAATGTGRIGAKARYEIRNESGEVVDEGPFARAYVLRDAQRRFKKKMEADLPDGEYTIKVTFEAVHLKEALTKQITVDWPKPLPVSQSDQVTTAASSNESNESTSKNEGQRESTDNQERMEPKTDDQV